MVVDFEFSMAPFLLWYFIKTEERDPSDRALSWKGIDYSLKETVRGCKGSAKLILEAVVNSTI